MSGFERDWGLAEAPVSLNEAQAWARVETGEEEAVLAGLVRSASALCEAFIGRVLMARRFTLDLRAGSDWQRVGISPVRSIDRVETVAANGTLSLLPVGSYAIDIDARGDGWVRLTALGSDQRVRVSGEAGMASEPNGVPEPLRQGILRLVGHMFATRDGNGGEPPAAVTALWRPYRRVRL